PERVDRAEVRLGEAVTPLVVGGAVRGALAFRTEPLAAAGVATASVSLAPRTLTLTRAQVAHYLDEIGADSAVRAAYARGDGTWTETYVKHTKTFVRVGDGGADTSWRAPLGQRLELVPHVDPTTLRAGRTLAVRLLRCGAPLAGQAVGWVRGGSTRARMATTDADGTVRIALDRPGRWLVRTTTLHRRDGATGGCALPVDPAAPDAEWRSDFATLVLEVR
ncbi:MAG: DUF4198 domain-containing protein, partial [Gemmatimonadaceae bacterium]|nr:DUF4198 domain-containing protein [Gemmatimonadaceae bacterium]